MNSDLKRKSYESAENNNILKLLRIYKILFEMLMKCLKFF